MADSLAQPMVCPVLVGRGPALAVLDRMIDRMSTARAQVLLISGEAGIGKSRLVGEIRPRAAARAATLLQGACFPQDRSCPFAPVLDMVRAHFADRADALAPFAGALYPLLPDLAPYPVDLAPSRGDEAAQEQRRLFAALARLILHDAADRPVVLIMEDLHWSDPTSLDFLLFLVRQAAALPLLIVGTYRSDEVGADLRHALAQLDRARLAYDLALAPLTRDDLAAMIQRIFDLAEPVRPELLDPLYALTEGNPFFLEELLKAMVVSGDIFFAAGGWDSKPIEQLQIPRSVQDAVLWRIEHVSAAARQVLELAAVAGRRFDFDLLQRITGCDEADLVRLIKELIGAQLVAEESADHYAFRHALTRQTLYAGLLARERQSLHRVIAETLALMQPDPPPDRLADLAHHYAEAGVWDQALEYAERAGIHAQASFAPQAAVHHLTRALAAAHALGVAPPPRIYRVRGRAYETLGQFAPAQADYEQALQVARAAGDSAAEWHILIDMGILWTGHDYAQTGDWFARALDLAEAIGEPRLRAHSLNQLGNWQTNVGRTAESLQTLSDALRAFEALGDQQGIAETHERLGMANGMYGDTHRYDQHYRQAIAQFRALGDQRGLAYSLAGRCGYASPGFSETIPGTIEPDQASREDLAESLRLARQIDWQAGQAFAEWIAAINRASFGHFGEALAHVESARQLAEGIGHRQWTVATHWSRGIIFVTLLAPDPAIAALEQALPLARRLGSSFWIDNTIAYLGHAYRLAGDMGRARALLGSALPTGRQPDNTQERRVVWAWGELLLAEGDAAAALRIAEELIASAPGEAVDRPIPALLKLRGSALLALGRLDDAAMALDAARLAAQARSERPLLWQIQAALGRAYRRLGREASAEAALADAGITVVALAATIDDVVLREQFLTAARAALHDPARPAARRRSADHSALTGRERDVIALIARGLSNRAIAEALVISEKTAEGHVSSILSKLGFSSRAQAATYAVQHDLLAEQ
ncbi:MAG: AAA family ATPase [Kouleothrix sp.]|nr:AAA family ATPase [Kouleothrix sp.]